MPSKCSAHALTNPRERIPDITATGVNVPIETLPIATVADAVTSTEARRASNATDAVVATAQPTQNIKPSVKLSTILPPLIFGTATFNYQFNPDPYALHPNAIVRAALHHGIRAFDTSPYYGPAESILGNALHSDLITSDPTLRNLSRSDYLILTKCGRISGDSFDYSPEWINHSVSRSLRRLRTNYLDVVYLHDVEFVSAAEVLTGIRALRNIRDTSNTIRYIGICGYPVATLAHLSELILRETGEVVDIVQSYANYTIQNQRLGDAVERFERCGVDVVTNASPLGMGLCRSQGVPVGDTEGAWHPAPDGLREACLRAAQYVRGTHHRKLEGVALRFAMEGWLTAGAGVGSCGVRPGEAVAKLAGKGQKVSDEGDNTKREKLGVSVMGVSKLSELEDTMAVYASILSGLDGHDKETETVATKDITRCIRENVLGSEWTDYVWESPEPGFKNTREVFGVSEKDREEFEREFGIQQNGVNDGAMLSKTQSRIEVKEISVADV
ncbi:hypothetical protein OHC33_009472 [Knufia fluminis]|uniref:NADP-dependent oxidoreductase domain-containing protein n=1 Tax=Knufia fluminis TaxID=191047 RepID=A0AAN8EAS1_9EURO|nr:hypothetical protein OHC33_009472 [Knufia fluminis]